MDASTFDAVGPLVPRPATHGYPTASAFVHANEGDRAAYDGADMPPELAEIENAVMDLSWHCRVPVLWYYTRRGPVWWKALQCRVSKTTFLRRVRTAEDVIDRRLQIVDRNGIDSPHSGATASVPHSVLIRLHSPG